MKLFDKEYYELIDCFEKIFSHKRLDKESKELWNKQIIYQDGQTNELFKAYILGYSNGISKN